MFPLYWTPSSASPPLRRPSLPRKLQMTTAKATITTQTANPTDSAIRRKRIQLNAFLGRPVRTSVPAAGMMSGLKNVPSASDSSPLGAGGGGVAPTGAATIGVAAATVAAGAGIGCARGGPAG